MSLERYERHLDVNTTLCFYLNLKQQEKHKHVQFYKIIQLENYGNYF